jgi:hypothetical protein
MSLVNLRGMALGEDVLAVAPVVWVADLVVPVVTDFNVSIWCGELMGGTSTGGDNGLLTETGCLTDCKLAGSGSPVPVAVELVPCWGERLASLLWAE